MTVADETLDARIVAQETPLRQASLCLLLRDGEILLARKKRGFGLHKWNGVGGKPEPGESIDQTTLRETEEEIGVVPRDLRRVATLDFFFPATPEYDGWDQQVCVYTVTAWEGEPIETEEVAPCWFALSAIPYDAMWADDLLWLPHVLRGELVRGQFLYDGPNSIGAYRVTTGSF